MLLATRLSLARALLACSAFWVHLVVRTTLQCVVAFWLWTMELPSVRLVLGYYTMLGGHLVRLYVFKAHFWRFWGTMLLPFSNSR